MSFKDWDSYTLSCPSGGWSVTAQISRIPSSRIFSIRYTDNSTGKECVVEEKRLHFKLEKDWKEDSYIVFSGQKLLLSFIHKNGKRNIIANAPNLSLPDGRKGLMLYLTLKGGKTTEENGPVVRCADMKASGNIRLGNDTLDLKADNCTGCFEWGRTK